jgi:DNA-binding Lrp family transcriptional regulator
MLLIVRLIVKGDPTNVWNYLVKNLKGKETKKVKPLYISQLRGKNYIGVIFDIEKIDYIVKFLVQQIGACEGIVDTQTLTLMKPVFLPIPKERPECLNRYTVHLKVEPRSYHDVYNELLDYKYKNDVFPTYITYSLGDFDIMISMLAEGIDKVKSFADDTLSNIDGVTEFEIYPIERAEHLASNETWRRLQRSLLHIPPWVSKELKKHYLYDYELSTEDYCKITGAMIDEL